MPWIIVLERRFELPWVCPLIQASALHPLHRRPRLCLLLLGIQSPRRLGIIWEILRIVVESWKICIALLFVGIDSEEPGWPWWQLERIRVERDLTLYRILNGDVSNLCGWPNFRNKYCVSVCFLWFTFCCLLVFFVFLSSRSRVTWFSLFYLVTNLLLLSLLLELFVLACCRTPLS
jgi:hypothetical protein